MSSNPLIPESKLPALGTTIFTQMSALAQQHQAINLSQGFPDFDGPRYLQAQLAFHVSKGENQYAPMTGALPLREAIAEKTAALYGYLPDVNGEITVTAGATQALFTAFAAFVRPGDEVIIFAPCYDSYLPAIETAGGKVVSSDLHFPDYKPDWDQVRTLISPRTRMIVINSPHNPTGSVLDADDLDKLAELTRVRVRRRGAKAYLEVPATR